MFELITKRGKRARLKDAAIWRVKIQEDQHVRASPEFQDWLRNELNWQAFAKVSTMWRSIENHSDSAAITAIADGAISRLNSGRRHSIFIPIGAWAGAAFACVVLLAGVINLAERGPVDHPVVYATDFNGLRTINLEDGSQIRLDASSSVTVHSFTQTGRPITLNGGRAQFTVAHDKSRPFRVTAGNEVTTAVGTAFGVERLGRELLVTVTQGKVLEASVQAGARAHVPVALVMGQQLVAVQDGKVSVSKIDLASEISWQTGRIVVDDQPLDKTVERLNRYLKKQVLVDAAAANIKISGVFNVGDLPTFLGALTKAFPVEVQQKTDGTTVILPRSARNNNYLRHQG